jgi:cytochrome c biogenesis protein ResB
MHEGTKLSQVGYDQRGHRWTNLGVSRDKGVWFVYAGFVATMLGLMGRFYINPVIRQLRAGSRAKGDPDGQA